jgi:preprotein translocase subunit SecF
VFTELIRPGTHIDFIGKRRLCAAVSLGLIAVSIAAIPIRGIRLGIDFAGGTDVLVRFDEGVKADEGAIREVATGCGLESPSVVRYGDSHRDFQIRFAELPADAVTKLPDSKACPLTDADRAALDKVAQASAGTDVTGFVVTRLADALRQAVGPVEVERVEFVGPKVGADLRRDGLKAIGIACLLILIYIAFRFSTRFAPGAVIALIHDVAITAGVFVLFGLEFDLRVLAALLAILGYSLNDTIIVYDRIRENMEVRTKLDLVDVLNRSVNQTLSRTILTSGTTMAATLALLFVGGEVIRPFALAMTIGIVVGTYSSIYIASPTLLWLERRAAKGPPAAGGGRPADSGRAERKAERKAARAGRARA